MDIPVHVKCAGEGSRQIREISSPGKGQEKRRKKGKQTWTVVDII